MILTSECDMRTIPLVRVVREALNSIPSSNFENSEFKGYKIAKWHYPYNYSDYV